MMYNTVRNWDFATQYGTRIKIRWNSQRSCNNNNNKHLNNVIITDIRTNVISECIYIYKYRRAPGLNQSPWVNRGREAPLEWRNAMPLFKIPPLKGKTLPQSGPRYPLTCLHLFERTANQLKCFLPTIIAYCKNKRLFSNQFILIFT